MDSRRLKNSKKKSHKKKTEKNITHTYTTKQRDIIDRLIHMPTRSDQLRQFGRGIAFIVVCLFVNRTTQEIMSGLSRNLRIK